MADLEKEYFNKWINQVRENKELKSELEKYKRLYNKNGDFQKQYLTYKKYFEPLVKAYKEIYNYSIELQIVFEKLIELYKTRLLLNSSFTKVKIEKNELIELLNETKSLLRKYQDISIPDRFNVQQENFSIKGKKKEQLIPIKKNFELKNFVVKKNKTV